MCIKFLDVRPVEVKGNSDSAFDAAAGIHSFGIMCDMKRGKNTPPPDKSGYSPQGESLCKGKHEVSNENFEPHFSVVAKEPKDELQAKVFNKIAELYIDDNKPEWIEKSLDVVKEIKDGSYATLWVAPDMIKIGDIVVHRDEAEDIICSKSFNKLNFIEKSDSNDKVHYFLQYYMTGEEDSWEILVINEVPLMWEVCVAPRQANNTILKGQRELIQIELMRKMAAELKDHPVRSKVRHALAMSGTL